MSNWEDRTVESAEKFINKQPLPQQPRSYGQSYEFPDDMSNILASDLGKWLGRLAAWKGYLLRVLAAEEMQLSIYDDTFDTMVAKSLGANMERKPSKDMILGKLISESEDARNLRARIIEQKARVGALKRVADIYTLQFDCISREISRRNQDIQLLRAGVVSGGD